MSGQISSLNELLRQQLLVARQLDERIASANASGVIIDIPETGKILSSAYEQLRNAAEFSEEHLLLQRAIKRFCKRNLFLVRRHANGLGTELIVELVQAGYLRDGAFSKGTAAALDQLLAEYMATFGSLRQAHIAHDTAMNWVLALMSSEAAVLLNPHHSQQATVFFAYHHFTQSIPRERLADLPNLEHYEFCVYIAVHQALLKSDLDIVRRELMTLYKQSPADVTGFKNLNQQIDELFNSPLTQRLKRIISRYGAPFRVLKSLVDDRPDIAEVLPHQQLFMKAYNEQIAHEYKQVHARLNRRLAKSIAFIFITKVLVGLSIEVPYDIFLYGSVVVLPLCVNLLFPPLYMASLKLSVRPPTAADGRPLHNYIENLLYSETPQELFIPANRTSSIFAKFIYAMLFAVPIATTILVLERIHFNIVQMLIFFVFFSTASFLGFRLSALVRDLELTTRHTGLLASMRDFFYLPFIIMGQWISRKYGSINAVGRFLDVAIELPLKAVLRLVRQWIRFLNERHEELY